MHSLRILLAEDMAHERLVIETNLRKALPENMQAIFTFVDHAEAAVERARALEFDLFILDIDFSQSERSRGMTGLQASKLIKALRPNSYSVVISSSEEQDVMTAAVDQFGVDWYIRRSSISYPELAWLAKQALLSRLHAAEEVMEKRYQFLTDSPAAKRVLRRVDSVLPAQNVLIYGETGTGKELIARRIHANAKLFDPKRPLKILDCSALSPTLFEGEVFGHRKGAFTGATSDRIGALQLANGGELFLDEIHNIPPALQQKLLRVLNDGVFSPVGSNEEIKSSFRIIAATNVPIEEAIASGKLLPDFVERLRKIQLNLVPLRERPEDISFLVERHLDSVGSFDKEFSEDAFTFMRLRKWSGNIRELNGFVDTAIAEVKIPVITRMHLERIFGSAPGAAVAKPISENQPSQLDAAVTSLLETNLPLSVIIEQLERTYLSRVQGRYQTIREMADAVGYSRATLSRRLSELGITLKQ